MTETTTLTDYVTALIDQDRTDRFDIDQMLTLAGTSLGVLGVTYDQLDALAQAHSDASYGFDDDEFDEADQLAPDVCDYAAVIEQLMVTGARDVEVMAVLAPGSVMFVEDVARTAAALNA